MRVHGSIRNGRIKGRVTLVTTAAAALSAATTLAVVQRGRAETAFDAARHGPAADAAVAPLLLAFGFGFAAAANDAADDGHQSHDDGENASHDHTDH